MALAWYMKKNIEFMIPPKWIQIGYTWIQLRKFSQLLRKWFCAWFKAWKWLQMVGTWKYSKYELPYTVFKSLGHFWAPQWAKKAQKGPNLKLPKFHFYWLKCICKHHRKHTAWFLGRKSLNFAREMLYPLEKIDLRKSGYTWENVEKMVLCVI